MGLGAFISIGSALIGASNKNSAANAAERSANEQAEQVEKEAAADILDLETKSQRETQDIRDAAFDLQTQASYKKDQISKSMRTMRRQAQALEAKQKVAYSSSGVRLEGSPLLVMEETKMLANEALQSLYEDFQRVEAEEELSIQRLGEGIIRINEDLSRSKERVDEGVSIKTDILKSEGAARASKITSSIYSDIIDTGVKLDDIGFFD